MPATVHLVPRYTATSEFPDVCGWMLYERNSGAIWDFDNPLVFGRKRDVELAIEALTEAGITTEQQWIEISDADAMQIICQRLQW